MRTVRTATTAALAALVLAGCGLGGDDGGGGGGSPSSSAGSGSSSSAPSDSGDDLAQSARDAGIDPAKPPKPVATVPVPAEDKDEPLTLGLISLQRQDDLVLLTASITPDAGSSTEAQDFYSWTGRRWHPQLLDTANLKVHDVVTASSKEVISDTGPLSRKVGPGQTLYVFAAFAAPPKDVSTVTVRLDDDGPAIRDVAIR